SPAFSARFSPFLSTQRLLLVAHLAQTGSYRLKLSWLDLIYCGMVRKADCLVFVVVEDAAFELTRDRHSVPPFGSRSSRKKGGLTFSRLRGAFVPASTAPAR